LDLRAALGPRGARGRIFLLSRIELALLVLIVADMVLKPRL
jgi:hypothetical protein